MKQVIWSTAAPRIDVDYGDKELSHNAMIAAQEEATRLVAEQEFKVLLKDCLRCGEPFAYRRKTAKYCSHRCRQAAHYAAQKWLRDWHDEV